MTHQMMWSLLGLVLVATPPLASALPAPLVPAYAVPATADMSRQAGITLGLWAEAEGPNRTLDSLARLEALLEEAHRLGVRHLFLQVYRGNRSWYPSSLADDAPFREALAREGYDPLAFVLSRAHGKGIKVHAWMNLFNLARNREARILKRLGREAILVDTRGRSLLDYPTLRSAQGAAFSRSAQGRTFQPENGLFLDTPGYWLDPAHPGVQRYLIELIVELVRRYPRLDGLHFDYIRYPYIVPWPSGSNRPRLDFGYGESATRFLGEMGLDPSLAQQDPALREAWDGWRKKQISSFLQRLRLTVKRLNPKLLLSAALMPSVDRATLALQDWSSWMGEGLLDLGIIMNYTKERATAQTLSRQAVALKGKGRIFVGLGTYLFDEPELLLQQIRDASASGADGVVLFSYDNLLKKEGLVDAISSSFPGR